MIPRLPLKENLMVVTMKALGASLSLPTFVFPSSLSGLCQPAVNACTLLAGVEGDGSGWRWNRNMRNCLMGVETGDFLP
jgi:hypothetical protein